MKHHGIADPAQLSMLEKALADFCEKTGISENSAEREQAAIALIALYESGMDDHEGLVAALLARPRLRAAR